jgi:arylsulfatase A-like enzyme
MGVRSRFNVIVLFGLVFLALVIHDLANTRLRIIIERESPGYLLQRLPGPPILAVVGGILAALALLSFVVFINRRFDPRSQRRLRALGNAMNFLVGTAFVAAGCFIVWVYPRHPLPQELSGALAIVVGVSLVLLTLLPSKRALLYTHAAWLAIVLVAVAVFQLNPGHRKKVKALRNLIETARQDIEQKRSRMAMVSADEIMADAAARADEHLVYRFEEHLGDITNLEAPPIEGGGVLLEIPRDAKFVVSGSPRTGSEIQDGKQVFADYQGGTLLKTSRPIDLEWSEVGSFVITMNVSSGSYFQVFWGEEYEDRHSIRVPLGAPGQSVSYEIKEMVIEYHGEGTVGHIWIVPSNQSGRVEIESFRALDRTNAVLKGAPFSVGYENVDDEIRKALFVATPTRLTYKVKFPRNNARIEFGLAASHSSIPTKFDVRIGHGGGWRTVFSTVIEGDSLWHDYELNLSYWAGQTVDVMFVTTAEERTLGLWSNPVLLGEPMDKPNVVVFLVDALRADHMGAYGYFRNTSPVFDSLCTKGALFERTYSNGTTTKYSIPSLFTSNPISATGVRHQTDVLPDEFPTLAEILRAMGYATASFITNSNAGPYSGSHQGFSRLYTRPRFGRYYEIPTTPVDAEVLVGELLHDWLGKNADRNFFLYVHTVDVHAPYDPPEPYRHYYEGLDSGTPVKPTREFDPTWIKSPTVEGRRALYDGEIEYGDVHFGRFIEMLDEAGVLDNTIIFFTADHGEYLGEHGRWGHSVPMFVQGTHIPLLILGPGVPAGVRVDEIAQILDVMPTALDAVGLEPDPLLFHGKSLLPLARGESRTPFENRTVFIEAGHPGETAFHCGDFQVFPEQNLIFDLTSDPTQETYYNEFLLDFGVKAMGRKLVKEYLETYAAFHEIVAPAGAELLEVDPETLRQLRALGYIE